MNTYAPQLPLIDPARAAIVEKFGAVITAFDPIGVQVSGVDLSSKDVPRPEVVDVLERDMAHRVLPVPSAPEAWP